MKLFYLRGKAKSIKILFAALFAIIVPCSAISQSSSVFDAVYFENNSEPPIKIGRGFHINDIYRQTRSCFTTETSSMSKLTAQQTGGRTTSIKMFYTRTNSEYNDLKRRGRSGKVCFLNLFSLGGQKLSEYANTTVHDKERLLLTINVDFGVYTFDKEPVLLPEAKSLISQNKLQDFVNMYGTHYISGVRKENSITVVLTKTQSVRNTSTGDNYSIDAGAALPGRGSGSFEIEDEQWINERLTNASYDVKLEVKGPSVDQIVMQQEIVQILRGDEHDKLGAISKLLRSTVLGLNNSSQAMITQYYYSPFSLYGLQGIHWDQQRESKLTKINEAVILVYAAKSKLGELVKPSGKRQIENELRTNNIPQEYISRISAAYNNALPALNSLYKTADGYLQRLQNKYSECSNLFCNTGNSCCSSDDVLNELGVLDLDGKIDEAVAGILAVTKEVKHEMDKPECEKLQKGTIVIQNTSLNPYDLYSVDHHLGTLQPKQSMSFSVDRGTYRIRAVQKSGYVFYATVNNRTAVINQICQEVKVTIGYEDK